jgi:tetratricopeptide (TPR) repeat protein
MSVRAGIGRVAIALALLLCAGCSPSAKRDRHLQRADRFFGLQRYREAAIEYMNVLQAEATNAVALRGLGLSLYATGDARRAYPALAQALAQSPTNTELRVKMAAILFAAGQTDEAGKQAEKVLEAEAGNFEALMVWSASCATAERAGEAIDRLKAFEEKFGGIARYHLALGTLYMRRQAWDEAEKAIARAAELDPKAPEPHVAMGDLLLTRGREEDAGREYEIAVEKAPPVSAARLKWAGFLMRGGKLAEAREVLKGMIEASPDYMPALFSLAELSFIERKFDEAMGQVEKVLSREPGSVAALALRAHVLTARGEADRAIAEYRKILEARPGLVSVRYHCARAYLRKGDANGAAEQLKQAIAASPDYEEAILLLAELDIRSGRPDPAVEALRKFRATHPDNAQACVLMGTAYRAQKNPAEAIRAYQDLARLQPDSPQSPYMVGLVLWGRGDKQKARASFEEALRLAPGFVPALVNLVSMDIEEKRPEDALGRIRRQVEAAPQSPELRLLEGRVLTTSSRFPEAEAAFEKALELQPRMTLAYVELGRLYAAQGKTDQALEKLESAIKVNPSDLRSLSMSAILHQQKGEYDKAIELFEKALQVNPQFVVAANNLAYLYSEHSKDYEKAFRWAQQAREAAPHDPYVADTLGWVLNRRGDYRWAASLLQESAEQLRDKPEVQYHLGVVLYQLGDERAALEAFRKALAAGVKFEGADDMQRLIPVLETDPLAVDEASRGKLESLLSERPDNPSALVRLASIEERAGKIDKARELNERALRASTNFVPALVGLARLHSDRLADPARAIELAKRAREIAPDDPAVTETLGWAAFLSGDYTWAYSLLGEAAGASQNPQVLYRAARAGFMLGRFDEARRLLRKALELPGGGPGVAEAKALAGVLDAYASVSPSAKDEELVLSVLERDKRDPPATLALAAIRAKQGKAGEAIRLCEQAMADHPDMALAARDLASLYVRDGRTNEVAVKLAQKARAMLPADPTAAGSLGVLMYKAARFEYAINLLKEASQGDPGNTQVLFCLGMSQKQRGARNEAKASLTKALELGLEASLAGEARKALDEIEQSPGTG